MILVFAYPRSVTVPVMTYQEYVTEAQGDTWDEETHHF